MKLDSVWHEYLGEKLSVFMWKKLNIWWKKEDDVATGGIQWGSDVMVTVGWYYSFIGVFY